MKFGNRHIYKLPDNPHLFGTEQDAKYHCTQHGIDPSLIERYDSRKEFNRWLELQQLQREGKVSDLRRQVEFELIPEQRETVHVKDRTVNDWVVENEHFRLKKDAWAYCRAHGLAYSSVACNRVVEPVMREVVLEKRAVYTADFVYRLPDGSEVVEDTKSEVTRKEPDYVLRRKWMLYRYGIKIKET